MANHTIRGQQRDKPFRDALRIEAKALENGELNKYPRGSLRWNAQQLLMMGEPQAIREIADRLDGKVPQAVVGDSDYDPVRMVGRIERVVIDPANTDGASIPPAVEPGSV